MESTLTAVYRCVAALDAHQAKLTVCLLYETETGDIVTEIRAFGGFKRDRREMAAWVASFHPELVVIESTGIYWKSPYAALEWYGLNLAVVNARHLCPVGMSNKCPDARRILPTPNGWPFWLEAVCCEADSCHLSIFGTIA